MLVQPIEGDGAAIWVPYVDIAQLDEIDDSDQVGRHVDVGLRDGRRVEVVFDEIVLQSLLAALAASQATGPAAPVKPAEFDIGGPPPSLHQTPSPPDVSARPASPFSPLDRAASPTTATPAFPVDDVAPGATAGHDSGPRGSRRTLVLAGVGVLALIALIIGAFLVLSGGDDTDVATPDTTASTTSTTSSPTTPPAQVPDDALSVTALGVTAISTDEGRSLYADFQVNNLSDTEIASYELRLTVAVDGAAPASATFNLTCSAQPLPAGASLQGAYVQGDAELNRDQFSNCTVAGWPVSPDNPDQVALADALTAGVAPRTSVELRSVTLADGTRLST